MSSKFSPVNKRSKSNSNSDSHTDFQKSIAYNSKFRKSNDCSNNEQFMTFGDREDSI